MICFNQYFLQVIAAERALSGKANLTQAFADCVLNELRFEIALLDWFHCSAGG
jgi:hypothetical protein